MAVNELKLGESVAVRRAKQYALAAVAANQIRSEIQHVEYE